MANHKSAVKKARQDIVRRERNRAGRKTLRTALKKFRAEIAAGSAESCRQTLPSMFELIDRTRKRGLIHANAANRLKSHLSSQVHQLG